jgi:hypothetical protein
MFTLEDIYNRLGTGAAGAKRLGPFVEPSSGPASTGHTLDEVMGLAPTVDDTDGTIPAEVVSGKTFWGLTSGNWGLKTGTMPNNGGCDCSGGTLNGTRWCDNGDGTVTDLITCLVWLKDAYTGGAWAFWVNTMDGTNAHDRAAQFKDGVGGLTDGSVEGDWRLPTKTELYNLANGTEAVRSGNMRAFTGVQSTYYWSSTTCESYTDGAWGVYLDDGYVTSVYKGLYDNDDYVWPVRSGN